MLMSIWAFGFIGDRAEAQQGADHSDLGHHHGFTGPGDVGDWPPRPVGSGSTMTPADAAVSFAIAAQQQAATLGGQGAGLDGLQAQAAIDDALSPAMADVLGNDWLHISSAPAKNGKDDFTPAEETFFSRSLNQTVIVRNWPGGPEILTFAPDQLQPVVTAVEEAEAAELGRAWLLDQGIDGVGSLEGFGIRALESGELHPVRMVYVTYASSWFDDPVYSALVDLTNGIVVEGGAL